MRVVLFFFFILAFCHPDETSQLDAKFNADLKEIRESLDKLKADSLKQLGDVQSSVGGNKAQTSAELKTMRTQLEENKGQISNLNTKVQNLPKLPADIVTKKELDQSFEHVQSLLNEIQMPDVSKFIGEAEVKSIVGAEMKSKIEEIQTELRTINQNAKKLTSNHESTNEGLNKELEALKKDASDLKKQVKQLKNSKKQFGKINSRLDDLENLQKEQKKQLKKLHDQQQQTIDREFVKLKNDIKEELKRDAQGVFASMMTEIQYTLSLVRDSYTHVSYDIAVRLGFEKSDVDNVFGNISSFMSSLWTQAQNSFSFAKEKIMALMEVAKEKLPVVIEAVKENTGGAASIAYQYAMLISTKIQEVAVAVWEFVKLYTMKGVEKAQSFEADDFKNAANDAMSTAKREYEGFKSRNEVRSAMKSVAGTLGQVFPDKSANELENMVEMALMGIIGFIVFFILYLNLKVLYSCFCRRRSKIVPSANEKKEPEPQTPTKKGSEKKTTPRKKQKKSRKN
jgi:hypothetical protein